MTVCPQYTQQIIEASPRGGTSTPACGTPLLSPTAPLVCTKLPWMWGMMACVYLGSLPCLFRAMYVSWREVTL